MQCTTIHNVVVNNVFSECERGNGCKGESDNNIFILVGTASHLVGMHSLNSK